MFPISLNLRPFKTEEGLVTGWIFGVRGFDCWRGLGIGWVFLFTTDFLARNCLTGNSLWTGALSTWRIQWLGQSSGPSLRTASGNRFSITT